MFFPDAAAALREFHRVLRTGGRMAACVWSKPERAPFIGILPTVLASHVPSERALLERRAAFGDPERLRALASAAGFAAPEVRAVTRDFVFAGFADYWEPITGGGSPSAAVYNTLADAQREAVRNEVEAKMAPYVSGEQLVLSNEVLILVARK
jgi:ubiquinone/menaquinone biosynthesis C-methylase UbiE